MTIKTVYRVEVEFQDETGINYTTDYMTRVHLITHNGTAPISSGSQYVDGIVTEWAEYESKIRALRAEAELTRYIKSL